MIECLDLAMNHIMMVKRDRAVNAAINALKAVDTTFTISFDKNAKPPTFVEFGPARLTICSSSVS